MNKRGILIITLGFRPNIGGLETHLNDLCEYLCKKNKYKVFVITYQPLTTRMKASKIERKGNLEIHRIRKFGYNWFYKLAPFPLLEFLYLFPSLMMASFFFLLKNRKRINVIHAQGLVCGVVGMVLAKFFKKRAIFSTHSMYNLEKHPYVSGIMKRILLSFDSILCLSQKSKEELIGMGIDEEKIKVYTYWVNQKFFSPLNHSLCEKELHWEDKFIILFVGRLVEAKGVPLLLKATESFKTPGNKISFAFIGEGPLGDRVKVMSENNERIIYVGKIDNQDLNLYYNAADIVIIPSIDEREGFARVIVEALSCGTPVIASNRGTIPEALDESVGLLIEPEVSEIVKSINYIYDHPQDLERLRSNCREYARKRFSENNARIIEESYGGIPPGTGYFKAILS